MIISTFLPSTNNVFIGASYIIAYRGRYYQESYEICSLNYWLDNKPTARRCLINLINRMSTWSGVWGGVTEATVSSNKTGTEGCSQLVRSAQFHTTTITVFPPC